MKAVIAFLKKKSLIEFAGVVALCGLIWVAGPRLDYPKDAILEPEINRVCAILAVVLVWIAVILFRKVRANRKDQQLVNDLVTPRIDSGQAAMGEAQEAEAAIVREKFEKALTFLRKNLSKGRFDRQYLYQLPLYVIIGAPGCGKTTLLLNSGLNFPVSGHLGENDIPGVGGTRNCDWLFADNVIFLDTAGRWLTQDSYQPVDAAAWKTFLGLIKKSRPRRPINGVLVTMSMKDLLQQTGEERWQHAKTVRQRIMELYAELGVRFPIYMLFTKCDLVAGFSEFFAPLDQEERTQVWGETFQETTFAQSDENIIRFESNLDDLLGRLDHRTFKRIYDEREIQRRGLILDFPQQMKLLKPAIKGFLRDTFGTSRFEDFQPLLRGVYFTSATQEGSPIDRVMGLLAGTYGFERRPMAGHSGRGKSFFITRLLKEVVLKESVMAGSDPRFERRRWLFQGVGYALLAILAASVILAWWLSYNNNIKAITSLEKQIADYKALPESSQTWDGTVRSILARLNAMEQADYDRFRWMGGGLYQGEKLRDGFGRVYRELLEKNLLPVIKNRFEQRIADQLYGFQNQDLDQLYNLLKVYLMLGETKRMDPKLAALQINRDWQQCFPNEPQVKEQLIRHSNQLLNLSLDRIELDNSLIAKARGVLNTQPLYDQIYSHLQTEAAAYLGPSYDIELIKALPPMTNSDRVFNNLDEQSVQGLYTYEGYHEFFKKRGPAAVESALQEDWVLNTYTKDRRRDINRMWEDLQKLYFHHYKKEWHNLMGRLAIRKVEGYDSVIQLLGILSDPEYTPLRPLLELVAKNTILEASPDQDNTQGSSEKVDSQRIEGSPLGRRSPGGYASQYVLDLEKEFEDLDYLVRPIGKSSPPLDAVLKSLSDVRNAMIEMKSDGRSFEDVTGGKSAAIETARLGLERQPSPLNSWLSSLTSSSMKFTLANAKSELNAKWRAKVLVTYKTGLQGRYPILKSSPHDATLTDFSNFFKPNGIIDQFFNENLSQFIDNSRATWRQRKSETPTLYFSSEVIRQFQLADAIRKAFFASGGSSPVTLFELTPVRLDPKVETFRLNIEGQTAKYQHGPPNLSKVKFQWPGPQPNVGVRLTFQTTDGEEVIRAETGPWAWFKILDEAFVQKTDLRDKFTLTFELRGLRMVYDLQADSVYNPFTLDELQNFHCTDSL